MASVPNGILSAIMTLSPAGGGGKTTTARFIEAGLTISDQNLEIVEADVANAGFTEETCDGRVRGLMTMDAKNQIASFVSAAKNAKSTILIDSGAGLLSQDASVLGAFFQLRERLRDAGYLMTIIVPISSNKGQSEQIVQRACALVETGATVLLALTDASGTGKFPDWIREQQYQVINVPRVQPGVIALAALSPMPLSQFLTTSTPSRDYARAHFARAVKTLFRNEPLQHLLSDVGRQALSSIARLAAEPDASDASTAAKACDASVAAWNERQAEVQKLWNAACADPAHPMHQLTQLADHHRRVVIEQELILKNAFSTPSGAK